MKHAVHVVRCPDYEIALPEAFERLAAASGLFDAAALCGKRVLVKPNLLTDRLPEQAVTTHPSLVRLVIRRLKAAGAVVSVGDSPASTANLKVTLERSGIGAVCEEEGVPFVSFEQGGVRNFEQDGFSFLLAKPVVEADLLVNLPKVKSHSLTKLTAAVKNLYGAVPGYSKTTLHRLYPKPETFGRLLQAIWNVLPPAVSLADAVVGMEGQGPSNGKPVRLGFLAASDDPFALDTALCGILHLRPSTVPYLKGCETAHTPEVLGDDVSVPSFEIPSGSHLLDLLPAWLVHVASRLLWVRPAFVPGPCVRCGKCAQACPASALALRADASVPRLDAKACIGCACCHEVCPKGAIRMKQSAVLRLIGAFKGLD
ncbi:MAG: DUF362 domain-containing protein [Kiritimatiellae bacterium]|nr:DUF362 domain-containing protein [Kiritimatiellia bacterium]